MLDDFRRRKDSKAERQTRTVGAVSVLYATFFVFRLFRCFSTLVALESRSFKLVSDCWYYIVISFSKMNFDAGHQSCLNRYMKDLLYQSCGSVHRLDLILIDITKQ